MSEEIHNAALVIPRSLLIGLMLNGTLGLAMLVSILYFMGDIQQALAENPLYPFMSIIKYTTRSTSGAAAVAALIIFMGFTTTTGVLASASRVYWAFARDRGIPAWKWFRRVNPKTGIPLNSVIVTAFIAVILSLVNIGSAAAFTGAVSISISGLYGSYLIVSSLLLYRRLTGGISPYQSLDESDDVVTDTQLGPKWGPWKVPGVLGAANNAFTCAFLIYVLFFCFWPSYKDVTPQNMNWTVLVTGVVLTFSVLYYLIWARHVFKGPILETTAGNSF